VLGARAWKALIGLVRKGNVSENWLSQIRGVSEVLYGKKSKPESLRPGMRHRHNISPYKPHPKKTFSPRSNRIRLDQQQTIDVIRLNMYMISRLAFFRKK